jgi:hypothetical protein
MLQVKQQTATSKRLCTAPIGLSLPKPSHASDGVWGSTMTLTNLGLWLVLIGLLAIIPFGCIMTRQKKLDTPRGDLPT